MCASTPRPLLPHAIRHYLRQRRSDGQSSAATVDDLGRPDQRARRRGGWHGVCVHRLAGRHGSAHAGDLALYGGAATMLQQRLTAIGYNLGYLPLLLRYLPSLFRVLEAPPDLPVPTSPRPMPPSIRAGITFEHVAFTYPGQSEPVLRDVSLHLGRHESVALVGHNGAGKTTLVKLLLRLYDPTAGRILLDGVDLRDSTRPTCAGSWE